MNKRAISDATSLQDYLEFTVGIVKRIVNGNLTKPVRILMSPIPSRGACAG